MNINRARINNYYSEQKAAAKDHCHQRASAEGAQLASREPLRELLFMWPWGTPIGKVTVYDASKKACSAAKIDDFRFHDCAILTTLISAGVDLVTVKELLGHKTMNMTNRYTPLPKSTKHKRWRN
jgi:site-specific recombinase XerD